MFERMRELRTVEPRAGEQGFIETLISIFIGLYNAEEYLESIQKFIAAQSGKYRVLIVDNHSDDSTWEKLHSWPIDVLKTVTLVQNPINLGATGSLYLNLDLIETDWVSTIHQDDFYLDEHIDVQSQAIRHVNPNCHCVVTDMGSLRSNGRIGPGRPRASWALPEQTPETMFLSNLRLHAVPFPAAAFRVETLREVLVPWHSTAMPDTEWILKTLGTKAVHYIPRITMYYRENPLSESHSLDESESQLGNFMALNRVLNSHSFLKLLDSVREVDRIKFAEALYSGLSLRIRNPSLLNVINLVAAEQISLAWSYSEPFSLAIIKRAYSHHSSSRIGGLIDRLREGYKLQDVIPKFGETVDFHLVCADFRVSSKRSVAFLAIALRLLNALPYSARRRVFRLSLHFSKKLKKNSAWNFDWR